MQYCRKNKYAIICNGIRLSVQVIAVLTIKKKHYSVMDTHRIPKFYIKYLEYVKEVFLWF